LDQPFFHQTQIDEEAREWCCEEGHDRLQYLDAVSSYSHTTNDGTATDPTISLVIPV
jgi:hypothetical protein